MKITSALLVALAAISSTAQAATPGNMLARLSAAAPDANPKVIELALQAHECAIGTGVAPRASRLAVIDYSRPSTERRMWVFDLARQTLMYDEYVAHGSGTGDNMARNFSNDDGSHQTSLGLFTTGETYVGGNGYSLRMDGLEKGINDNARARAIVIHGAAYVNPALARSQGRIGRSWGCPALRPEVAHEVIDNLKQGQMLFAYYPDKNWLAKSPFLTCRTRNVAAAGGAIGNGIAARSR
ncbi:MAG: murein L,D-transpeptidase catalytic domain family protein [Arenimonas sp.]